MGNDMPVAQDKENTFNLLNQLDSLLEGEIGGRLEMIFEMLSFALIPAAPVAENPSEEQAKRQPDVRSEIIDRLLVSNEKARQVNTILDRLINRIDI